MARGNKIETLYSEDWKRELELDANAMQNLIIECGELVKNCWVAVGNGKQSLASEILIKLIDRHERLRKIVCA